MTRRESPPRGGRRQDDRVTSRSGVPDTPEGPRTGRDGDVGDDEDPARYLAEVVASELRRPVEVIENGRRKTMSVARAVVRRTVMDALRGSHRDRALILKHIPEIARELPSPVDTHIIITGGPPDGD